MQALTEIDVWPCALARGLHARGLDGRTDLIVLSDHGMAFDVRGEDIRYLDDLVPGDAIWVEYAGPVAEWCRTRPSRSRARAARPPQSIPVLAQNCRLAFRPQSAHPARPSARPTTAGGYGRTACRQPRRRSTAGRPPKKVFTAIGPSFRAGTRLPAFDNVDVSLAGPAAGIAPAANDGDIAPLLPALQDAP